MPAPPDRASNPSDASTDQPPLRVIDLGRLAYVPALARQRQVNQAVIDGREPPTLLLVEHEPVITLSHRRDVARHLLASREHLARLGIEVQQTDRGGDITYHGPGQLVAYPILQLGPLGLNLSRYMRMLESIVIDTLAAFGVEGMRDEQATGVWVDGPSYASPAKICAMGVRVRKNTTMHGLALNVEPDLTHFQTIVPCGLHDRGITSLAQLLSHDAPTMQQVKQQLVTQIQATIRQRVDGERER